MECEYTEINASEYEESQPAIDYDNQPINEDLGALGKAYVSDYDNNEYFIIMGHWKNEKYHDMIFILDYQNDITVGQYIGKYDKVEIERLIKNYWEKQKNVERLIHSLESLENVSKDGMRIFGNNMKSATYKMYADEYSMLKELLENYYGVERF